MLLHRVRHVRVEYHNRAEVASLAAVVARCEHRDEAAVVAVLEPPQTLWNLVGADAEGEGVVPQEAPRDLVYSFGFRVESLGFRVQGLGFRV